VLEELYPVFLLPTVYNFHQNKSKVCFRRKDVDKYLKLLTCSRQIRRLIGVELPKIH
jgi:hypothetical protein